MRKNRRTPARDKHRLPAVTSPDHAQYVEEIVRSVLNAAEHFAAPTDASTDYRPVPALPGYRVNARGRVQSCWGFGGTYMTTEWHTLQPFLADGRRYVRLGKDGKRNDHLVGALVLRAWMSEPPPDKRFVRHINCKMYDDRLGNLEWSEHKQFRPRAVWTD